MPHVNLSISKPNFDADPSSLSSQISRLVNLTMDPYGNVIGTPGRRLFCDLGEDNTVDMVRWSQKLQKGFAVCNGKIFSIDDNVGATTEITGTSALLPSKRATYCEIFDGSNLLSFFANGAEIAVSTDGAAAIPHPSANAPEEVTHVAAYDTYLIFNDASADANSWGFSNPNAPLTIDAADTYDAEKEVDGISVIITAGEYLYIMGDNSIETWINSGTPGDPLLRQLSSYLMENGIVSPEAVSIIDVEGQKVPIFMDKERRVMAITGSSVKNLSDDILSLVQDFATVGDAISFTVRSVGQQLFCTTFPSQRRTLAYNLRSGVWSELGEQKGAIGTYVEYDGFCADYFRTWDKYLVGGKDGKIYEISKDYYTNEDGKTLSGYIQTGHVDWGNPFLPKFSGPLTMRLKRGLGKEGDHDAIPYCMYRAFDNASRFHQWKKVSLGKQGDSSLLQTLYMQGGRYNTRQHELVFPDAAPVIISGLYENVEMGAY